MKKQYSYSSDRDFLNKIDSLKVKEQWVKITLLEYENEIPIKDIEGQIINGTLTKTGDAAVRRTCSLTCAVDAFKYDLENIQSDYSISKKIYLELGISNTTTEYLDEKIIWFPQGVFFITSFSISSSATGATTISLQFKDKMAQLDGTVGGVLPATVRFDMVTTTVNGITTTKKELIYNIIMEAVNHFGGESLSNIIIDDIPRKAKRIIKWMGADSVWIYPILSPNEEISYDICFASDLDEKQSAHTPISHKGQIIAAKEYLPNQDIGYMYEDFVYTEELTFKAGSKVTEVLDKIKNWLGNYEYFYDEQGQFHFQEIKNYLNNARSADIWDKIAGTDDSDYLYESTHGKTAYVFDDSINLVSITNAPSYENIKNDFIVEGTVTVNNVKRTCRYHLVIDDKPRITTEGYDNVLIYEDPSTKDSLVAKPQIVHPQYDATRGEYLWTLPEFAENGKIYGLLDEPRTFTTKKTLKEITEFAEYYDKLANQENGLIGQDNDYPLNDKIRQYLLTLLENYMGYADTSPYKSEYHDVIATLARQLTRYGVSEQNNVYDATIEYYESLYKQYLSDISNYGQAAVNKISWCGELLEMLYQLFKNVDRNHKPSNSYKDSSYWPAINTRIPTLWEGASFSNDENILRNLQKSRCLKYIDTAKNKQRQLEVLIELYNHIITNYDNQIAVYNRKMELTSLEQQEKSILVSEREEVQNQISLYQEELDICGQRLTLLYAALTVLGSPNKEIGEIFFSVEITIPVYVTSFWYYNNSDGDKQGWNELNWYQYYRNKTDSTTYYPDGLGSMTYIDYSAINWNNIDYGDFNFMTEIFFDSIDENNNKIVADDKNIILMYEVVGGDCPSMNRYSSWYQNYYINYAIDHDLPYFSEDKLDSYIPTNWRTELLLRGLRAEENGTDPGYYYQELKLGWPSTYDFQIEQLSPTSINKIDYFVGHTGVILGNEFQFGTEENDFKAGGNTPKAKFKEGKNASIQDLLLNYENGNYYYFFDMIDSSSPTWGEYSVSNIGRRTNVTVSDSVNCIFTPQTPNYAFINVSHLTIQEKQELLAELDGIAENLIQVTDAFYKNFSTGGYKQSAYEQIRKDLQDHTSYQNSVSVTALPCFYLEPNIRVELRDRSTNIFGDYIVKSISIPLGAGNNMSVSMSKAIERI